MSTLIKNLHIKNFKSVRDLKLDCDRINIFIGKPNAGKSNILEAISLLGAGGNKGEKFMQGSIRYKSLLQLFADFNFHQTIQVNAGNGETVELSSGRGDHFSFSARGWHIDEHYDLSWEKDVPRHGKIVLNPIMGSIKPDGIIDNWEEDVNLQGDYNPVKKYDFRPFGEFVNNGFFLHPPHGDNFYTIVRGNPELRTEIQSFLKPNGLDFLLDEESQKMTVVRKGETNLLSFPMHLVPDTFQRYIFHLAAIMSNRDSVLLFEEPETHSYAPYVYQLAQHIIQDEQNNQYFLTTHNPYLLTPILQETKDVALFVTWFEDYQTHARRLSEDEVSDILNYGLDVFLNLNHFIPA